MRLWLTRLLARAHRRVEQPYRWRVSRLCAVYRTGECHPAWVPRLPWWHGWAWQALRALTALRWAIGHPRQPRREYRLYR